MRKVGRAVPRLWREREFGLPIKVALAAQRHGAEAQSDEALSDLERVQGAGGAHGRTVFLIRRLGAISRKRSTRTCTIVCLRTTSTGQYTSVSRLPGLACDPR